MQHSRRYCPPDFLYWILWCSRQPRLQMETCQSCWILPNDLSSSMPRVHFSTVDMMFSKAIPCYSYSLNLKSDSLPRCQIDFCSPKSSMVVRLSGDMSVRYGTVFMSRMNIVTLCQWDWPLLTPATMSLSTEIIVDLSTGSTNHGSTRGVAWRAELMPIRPLEVMFSDLVVQTGQWGLYIVWYIMLTGISSG